MLRHLFSIFMCFSFLISTTHASTGPENLQQVVDEFIFAVTVEWDQRDEAFLDEQVELLSSRLSSFANKENSEYAAQMVRGLANDKTVALFQNYVFDFKNKSAVEVKDFIKKYIKQNYQSGASWAPVGEIIGITIGLLFVVWVFVAIIYACDNEGNCRIISG